MSVSDRTFDNIIPLRVKFHVSLRNIPQAIKRLERNQRLRLAFILNL